MHRHFLFSQHRLTLPVTKENFFDFRRSENEYEPVYIDGTAVEVCAKYNYLGTSVKPVGVDCVSVIKEVLVMGGL